MTKRRAILFVRWILTLVLIVFVYRETGIFTAASILLVAISIEIVAVALARITETSALLCEIVIQKSAEKKPSRHGLH